jgi:hypothetical protein
MMTEEPSMSHGWLGAEPLPGCGQGGTRAQRSEICKVAGLEDGGRG